METANATIRSQGKHPMIRPLLWKDSIQAVKLSAEFSDFKAFRIELRQSLHYNSTDVRNRYTTDIVKWFFPSHSLDNLLTKVWTFYKNEEIITELMRYQYLTIEPDVAEFVINYLIPLHPGRLVENDYLKDFLLKTYGVVRIHPLISLRGACRDLGFLYSDKKKLVVRQIPVPKPSLRILTHFLLAPTPRTVTVKEILSKPFWRYLGVREVEILRQVLREADASGVISKYIIADQLEQLTTRYSYEEFIQRRIRL